MEPGLRLAAGCMTENVTTSVFYLKPAGWSHSSSEVASEGHPRKEYSVGGKGGWEKKTGGGSSLGLEPTPKTQRPRGQRGVGEEAMPLIGHGILWLPPHLRLIGTWHGHQGAPEPQSGWRSLQHSPRPPARGPLAGQ